MPSGAKTEQKFPISSMEIAIGFPKVRKKENNPVAKPMRGAISLNQPTR